jgi:glucose-6-phosphate 1-dehydrogenase
MFLVSLPTTSFSEFEKELSGLSASTKADKVVVKKPVAESLKAAPSLKREGVDEKKKAPTKLEADQEGRTFVRILLVPE